MYRSGRFSGGCVVKGTAVKVGEWVRKQPKMRGKIGQKVKPEAGCVQVRRACVCPYFFTYIQERAGREVEMVQHVC